MPRLRPTEGRDAEETPPRKTRQIHKPGHPVDLPWKAERCGRPTRRDTEGGPAGTPCKQPAGWGTPNRSGPCRVHGGSLPTVQVAAAAQDQRKYADAEAARAGLWGHRVEGARPVEQLAEELARTAGRVAALEAHLVHLERAGAHQQKIDAIGAELSAERGHLLRAAEAAGKAGLGELDRQLAEADAQFVLDLLLSVLRDLRLDPGQIGDAQALFAWYLGNYAPGAPVDGPPATAAPKPLVGLPAYVPRAQPVPAAIEATPRKPEAPSAGRALSDGSVDVRPRRAGGSPLPHPPDPRHRAGDERN